MRDEAEGDLRTGRTRPIGSRSQVAPGDAANRVLGKARPSTAKESAAMSPGGSANDRSMPQAGRGSLKGCVAWLVIVRLFPLR
jgi:hypothetical protein